MAMTHFTDIKYMGYDSWFECWYKDCQEILLCMHRNMASDLDNGYNPLGNAIQREKQDISNYEKYISDFMTSLETLDDKASEKRCYHELLRKGAIN